MDFLEAPAYARPLDSRLLDQQVQPLYRDSAMPLAFGVVLAAFLVLLLWPDGQHARLLAWMGAVTMVAAARARLVAAYKASPAPTQNPRIWLNRFAVGAAISGAFWGATVPFLAPPHSQVDLLLSAVWPCGVAAGALAAFSISLRVLAAFVLPALLPGALFLVAGGGPLRLPLGGGMLAYMAFLWLIGRRMNKSHLNGIGLRIYNEQLVADVLGKNEKVAELNQRLEELLDERTTRLATTEAKYRTLFESAYDAIFLFKGERCVDCNAKAMEMFRSSREELLNRTPADFAPEIQPDGSPTREKARRLIDAALAGSSQHVAWLCRRPDGSSFDAEVGMNAVKLAEESYVQAIVRDVTERNRAQDRIRRLAYFDALTELPNGESLREHLDDLLNSQRQTRDLVGLLVLDVARFGEINVALGYTVGDRLLQAVARDLRRNTPAEWMVARLGASVFGVLQQGAPNQSEATEKAQALVSALEHVCSIDNVPVDVSIHAGLAFCPTHARTPELLLRHAEAAKAVSRERWSGLVVYNPSFDVDPASLSLIAELRSAIKADGLTLYYQPKLALDTEKPRGAEALVRWPHPERGTLSPNQFIPLAEKTGMITDLTFWAIERALRQCRSWRRAGFTLEVSVNICTRDLYHPDFVHRLAAIIHHIHAEPQCLILEITESVLMEDPEFSANILNQIHRLGIMLSLDDFGTGYSSLAYLARLPIHELKIDKSFVAELHSSHVSASIVRSTIGLAHDLGLRVTAEGIEDAQTLKVLRLLGCDLGQGYGISRPLPAADFGDWLKARS